MRRIIATLVLTLAATLGMSGLASADGNGGDYCGDHRMDARNRERSLVAVLGHGAFGAFGKGNDWRGGADGDNTAYANSRLCGNPQGAAGVDE